MIGFLKKVVPLLIFSVITIGCSSAPAPAAPAAAAPPPPPVVMSTGDYIEAFKAAELPIGDVIVYTEETDENKLLGRPNQYIEKCNFADTRIEQMDPADPAGGSIEIFNSNADAVARKAYIDSFGKDSPMFVEYSYINEKVLLRLNKDLTPTQAKEYETEFMK